MDLVKSKALKELLKIMQISPQEYLQKNGSAGIAMMKTKPTLNEEPLTISNNDSLFGKILKNINSDIKSTEIEENPINFNLSNIAVEELSKSDFEMPKNSTWYEDYEEEFKHFIPDGIKIIQGFENMESYWLILRLEETDFMIKLPKLVYHPEVTTDYKCIFIEGDKHVQYIWQYLYTEKYGLVSFYQQYWINFNKNIEYIKEMLLSFKEMKELKFSKEILRMTMKDLTTFLDMNLSRRSVWLFSRQFKIAKNYSTETEDVFLTVENDYYDKVTGSFGLIGGKHSLKHGVKIELMDGRFKFYDEKIIPDPLSTERLMNLYPLSSGFKRINITDIEKMPLEQVFNGKEFISMWQDDVKVRMKEVDYDSIPPSEEVGVTVAVLDIGKNIGSLNSNPLDMVNAHNELLQKLTTVDGKTVSVGAKIILPLKEKAVAGGIYGYPTNTIVIATLKGLDEEKAMNLYKYLKKQNNNPVIQENGLNKYDISFEPDMIINHSNRDNNIGLRLLSNIRYKAITEDKEQVITYEEASKKILQEDEELVISLSIFVNGRLEKIIETQILFLTAYQQPNHSAVYSASYGKINTNYRQALFAKEATAKKTYRDALKRYKKEEFRKGLLAAGYEIKEIDIIEEEIKTNEDIALNAFQMMKK